MAEQRWIYVDADYLKELEVKAKKVDYYQGVIDGITMCKDTADTQRRIVRGSNPTLSNIIQHFRR